MTGEGEEGKREASSPEQRSPPSSYAGRLRRAGDYLTKVWNALTLIAEIDRDQKSLSDALVLQNRAIRDLRKDFERLEERISSIARENARAEARELNQQLIEQNAQMRERLAVIEAELKRGSR